MKILWLSHLIPYPPQGGGVLQRSFNLLKAVASKHEVTLLAFNQTALSKLISKENTEAIRLAKEHLGELCNSVSIVDIPCEQKKFGKELLALKSLFSPDSYTNNWLRSDNYKKELLTLLSSNSFDLVWFDTISLAQYLKEFSSVNAIKILDHHNIESDMLFRRSKKEKNLTKKLYFYQEAVKLLLYEKKVMHSFDMNVTCSALDSERLKSISGRAKSHAIPNGVDIDYFRPVANITPDNHSLIFVGGMSWYPNRDAMLFFTRSVWPKIKTEIPDIRMNVVGKTPPAELLSVTETDDNFKVYGFLDDVRPLMTSAGIYVCPISDGGGTKLKILDALAMGKAIVANPIACEGIDVEDGKNVIFATTPSDYVKAIKHLVSNPRAIKELGQSARNLAIKKYSYDVIGSDLLDLIGDLAKGS